jgi:hypothetical protein
MKKDKIIYWTSTTLGALMMLSSAFMYFSNPMVAQGFQHLGFPDYFRVELGVAKLLGAALIVVPQVPRRIKEWAYIGFFITFISASVAHINVGDGMQQVLSPILPFVLFGISYIYYHRLNPVHGVAVSR